MPAARHQGRGAPCGESFWHWALGADGGHGHAQPPFRSSRLIGAERQPTSDCRQSLQQSLRRHAHLALVHTSIEHSRDWCRSLLILNCQELAAQQPLRPINWCSRLLKMTVASKSNHVKKTIVIFTPILDCAIQNRNTRYGGRDQLPAHKMLCW